MKHSLKALFWLTTLLVFFAQAASSMSPVVVFFALAFAGLTGVMIGPSDWGAPQRGLVAGAIAGVAIILVRWCLILFAYPASESGFIGKYLANPVFFLITTTPFGAYVGAMVGIAYEVLREKYWPE